MPKVRINRALASAGIASRRRAEELIRAGRVQVNGKAVTDLATQVDPGRDQLSVDGKQVKLAPLTYYLYYKPRGMISTMSDERGRACVGDVCAPLVGHPRLCGRLDRESEGLILLTSDGDAAHRLAHPRYGLQREYQATLAPVLADKDAQRLVEGVRLEDGPGRFLGITLLGVEAGRCRLEIVIGEGRNRFIRRMCAALGYEVLRLKRVRLGPLALGKLKPGDVRQLGMAEAANLRKVLKLDMAQAPPSRRRRGE
ncbi:MAG: rRNA pseudouridine synthase [Anaerolineae bacterium]|nr:rRNA pseudouridine synthase [Anaerolineae bacterium]